MAVEITLGWEFIILDNLYCSRNWAMCYVSVWVCLPPSGLAESIETAPESREQSEHHAYLMDPAVLTQHF